MRPCKHVIYKRSICPGHICVIPGCHPFVREIEDIVLKQDLISLIYRMYYIIVDKCIVIYFCALDLCICILAHTYDHCLMRRKSCRIIYAQVVSYGIVSVVGIGPYMEHDPSAHIIVSVVILDNAVFCHIIQIKRHAVHRILSVAHFVVLEHHSVCAVAPDSASVACICLLERIYKISFNKRA